MYLKHRTNITMRLDSSLEFITSLFSLNLKIPDTEENENFLTHVVPKHVVAEADGKEMDSYNQCVYSRHQFASAYFDHTGLNPQLFLHSGSY
jgi:hypothetical protein